MKTAKRASVAVLLGASLTLGACCFLRPGWMQRYRPLTYMIHGSIPLGWVGSITTASGTWNGVWQLFNYGGYGGGGGNWIADGANSVFVRSTGFASPAVLAAVSFPGIDPAPGVCGLTDTDMGFNSNHPWSTNPSSFQVDVESVALHEFGHYGLLGHVVCPQSAVMYRSISYGQVKRSLRACDSLGMWVANVVPECWVLTGICFPSFSFLKAFDNVDDEDQGTTDPFKQYNEELIQIWLGDSTLRTNADNVGSFYSNLLDDWRNGGSLAYSYSFTSSRYQEIDNQIISRVYASASSGLRQRLAGVRLNLQGKIGMSIGNVFGMDIEEYPPAGGYERPGGGGPPPV
ncbi:MAG TPA: matrixin family metalloprotease [Thermoanaerobaculia bacterium]|nr:matrixin family metalloprotease [Thermoanaerobaculia bacterium]